MKHKELAQMKDAELQNKLQELRKQMMKDKTEIGKGSQMKNRGQYHLGRKTIARILTLLNQKKEGKKE